MEVSHQPQLHQDWIDPHAFGIVKALQKAGHLTFLVGGCVRDLLLGIHPKDFDIATMAHPPQVKRLIYMSYVIGKRFRLVLVKRDDQQFEVATFRREVNPDEFPEGAPFGDNVFGTPEEDAKRRDFTINALFYDPIESKLIDYVDGMKDIECRTLRMIGDPNVRLLEDPIRTLRALRLSHKLGFSIHPDLREAMRTHAVSLAKSVLPRRREEILKILRLKNPDLVLIEAFDLGVLQTLLPTLHALFEDPVASEVFWDHFRLFHRLAPDGADPTHLFGWLIFSYIRTLGEMQVPDCDDLEREPYVSLLRDELGMYKFEQTAVFKAIQVARLLPKAEDFKKRGMRRQIAVLKNEGFLLALNMAEVDYQLSAEVIQFWREAYERALPELNAAQNDGKPGGGTRRRGPRRRRPRGGGRGGQVAGSRGDVVGDSADESSRDSGSGAEGEGNSGGSSGEARRESNAETAAESSAEPGGESSSDSGNDSSAESSGDRSMRVDPVSHLSRHSAADRSSRSRNS